jgi:hypothetical protein
VMRETLVDLKQDKLSVDKGGVTFEQYKQLVGFADWATVEDRFGR